MKIISVKHLKLPLDNPDNKNNAYELVAEGSTWTVPLDPANRHYQAIQEWVAEGNKIEDAD